MHVNDYGWTLDNITRYIFPSETSRFTLEMNEEQDNNGFIDSTPKVINNKHNAELQRADPDTKVSG